MIEILKELVTKRFSVYIHNEHYEIINFLGLMQLLANSTDFFEENKNYQKKTLRLALKERELYIDCDTYVKVSK